MTKYKMLHDFKGEHGKNTHNGYFKKGDLVTIEDEIRGGCQTVQVTMSEGVNYPIFYGNYGSARKFIIYHTTAGVGA